MSPSLESQNLNNLDKYFSSDNVEGGLDLGEIKNILIRKFPLIAGLTLTMTSLALLKVLITPPEYIAGFELLSEPINIETKVTSSNEDSRKTREEITEVELDEVQLKILKSPQLIFRIVESLKDRYPEINYSELTAGLTIEIAPGSQEDQNVLEVTYTDTDKQKVADVVEALNKTYQDYSVEKRQSGVKRGIAFLDQQIPQVSKQSRRIEANIAKLRTKYNFNNPDSSLSDITARINQLSQKRETNAIELKQLQLILGNLQEEIALEPGKSTTALGLATPRYLELLSEKSRLDLEISKKSNVFSEQSDILQALRQDKQKLNLLLADTEADIVSKLKNKISVLENRQLSIADETTNLKSQLEQWSRISGEFNSLKQQLNTTNAKLNGFVSQKDALQIDAAQQKSPWQLLTPASEPVTSNISTFNYLLLGSSLGLILGISAALILDKQQKIIYTSAKVEELTSLPILASIPYLSRSKTFPFLPEGGASHEEILPSTIDERLAVLNHASPGFFIPDSIEAFRSFAANLGFFNLNNSFDDFELDNNIKSIVITSAIPREGKSTVALNLARASASMGKKVLLVDTDLRSVDCLTKNLGLESEIGLRNILGLDNPALRLDCVQPLPLEDNLFILTSGYNDLIKSSNKPDPSRMLASTNMQLVMEDLREDFDLIIYDLCAIIGFADVNLLAGKTDGIVMVTGLGKIQTMALSEAMSQLKLCKAPILGIAVNKMINKT